MSQIKEEILNLSKKVEKELRIVDLLNMKFEYLCKLLGNEKVVTLKNYLHQLGIKLTDEKVLFIEVSDTYDENTIFIKDVFDQISWLPVQDSNLRPSGYGGKYKI